MFAPTLPTFFLVWKGIVCDAREVIEVDSIETTQGSRAAMLLSLVSGVIFEHQQNLQVFTVSKQY